jgi:Kdo2-lipid IVA lauroyltransferase/acyltransferase
MSLWKRFRYRLEWLGCQGLVWLVPRLSRRACARLGRAFGTVAFHLDRRGRAVALANIELALGADAPARTIARESYRAFARTLTDLFWAPRLRAGNFRTYLRLEGEEALRKNLEAGRGAIFLFTHAGHFEYGHIAEGLAGQAGWGVAETFKNPLLTPIFQRLRGAGGNRVLAQEGSIVRLFKLLKKGETTGMLIDLTLRPDQPSAVVEQFGLQACLPLLHVALHQRTGAPLCPIEAIPLEDGTCRVIFHPALELPPDMPVARMAQACWDFFEPRIRARPELWLWAYKHWRYRPREAARSYPFYANVSSKFEKLLRRQAAELAGGAPVRKRR